MLKLYPMSYSKDRKMAKVRARLIEYPAQEMNTPEAMSGATIEWHIPNRSACGSLSEYKDLGTEFTLQCDDGVLRVKMDEKGKWFVS